MNKKLVKFLSLFIPSSKKRKAFRNKYIYIYTEPQPEKTYNIANFGFNKYPHIPKPMLQFSVHLTEHCNANCKSCAHFCPVAQDGFADIVQFEKDMNRLSELANGEMRYIDLLGGEPLLNPQLSDFINIARRAFPTGALRIITNGLLLAKMNDEFWSACEKFVDNIVISKYYKNVDYDSLVELAKSKGVDCYYIDYTNVGFWSNETDSKGLNDPVYSFNHCIQANNCHFLQNGKLYTCVKPATIHHFNKYFSANFKVSEKDGIDIYKAKSIDEILEYLAKPIPFCRYCNIDRVVVSNIVGKSSKKCASEWLLEDDKFLQKKGERTK